MKIAIISMIRDNWGGSEELWYDMAKTALRQGHEILHLSYTPQTRHPKMEELIKLGLTEYERPGFRSQQKSQLLRFADKLHYFLKKIGNSSLEKIFNQKPDIVLYNGTCYSIEKEAKLMSLLKKHTGTRFFMIGHLNAESEPAISQRQKDKISEGYARAEKVFFVSRRTWQNAEKHIGRSIPNGAVIRNPVNLQGIEIVPYPKITEPQMAMVGNLATVHKGQDIVLDILSSPHWQQQQWHLNIYGTGLDEEKLKVLGTRHRLDRRVTFHGKVSDIRAVWQQNHILLMPSLMEGMPLALVEAMICGRTSVVTDVGGNTEWVKDGQEGFIAAAPDEKAFEEALNRAFQNVQRWKDMGLKAHETAMQLFDRNAGATLLNILIK